MQDCWAAFPQCRYYREGKRGAVKLAPAFHKATSSLQQKRRGCLTLQGPATRASCSQPRAAKYFGSAPVGLGDCPSTWRKDSSCHSHHQGNALPVPSYYRAGPSCQSGLIILRIMPFPTNNYISFRFFVILPATVLLPSFHYLLRYASRRCDVCQVGQAGWEI